MTGTRAGQLTHQPALPNLKVPSASGPKGSPKRPREETAGLADVFPYYAGFSFEWARDQLSVIAPNDDDVVLDPWNGSGTTTLAATSNGHRSVGIDLNPIANLVASLRGGVHAVTEASDPPPKPSGSFSTATDPLLSWLSPQTVLRVRQWTNHLQSQAKPVSALGYVSLFRVVRRLTERFEGSNPTWVKRAASPDQLVHVESDQLDVLLVADQRYILNRLRSSDELGGIQATLITASANRLPLANRSVDVVLTSPPYLTRIDYAVAYARELAVVGVDIAKDRSLRSSLMGTTLIRPGQTANVPSYRTLATSLVNDVSKHKSKASAGYYLKQVRQYLDDLSSSFDEITRVTKDEATLTLVVQDSYYKDIHIRLAEICIEEAEARGWKLYAASPKEVTRLLTAVNTAARKYPKGKVNETVVTLKKG
ncbi:DNA methyltransferase [Micromonospora sp. NPDC005710]|uniref:DNA methyltransferase n=1 Tax=Micromonospora sp. NPDC005710 TaxID=3157051 RepID=UPI00340C2265